MTQKSLGMTFLNCCTMTLSHCFDSQKITYLSIFKFMLKYLYARPNFLRQVGQELYQKVV